MWMHASQAAHIRVIMGLSWPLPLEFSVNGCTPKESFLGIHKKMNLPSASNFCDLLRKSGRGCFLFAIDVAMAYRQLPLDPRDWSLVCFTFEGNFLWSLVSPLACDGWHLTVKLATKLPPPPLQVMVFGVFSLTP